MTKNILSYLLYCCVFVFYTGAASSVELFGRGGTTTSSTSPSTNSSTQQNNNYGQPASPPSDYYPKEYFNSAQDFRNTVTLYSQGKAISEFMSKKGIDYNRGSQIIHQLSIETNSNNSKNLLDAYKAYEAKLKGNNLGSTGALDKKFEYFAQDLGGKIGKNRDEFLNYSSIQTLSSKAKSRGGKPPIGYQGFDATERISQPTLNSLKSIGLSMSDINFIGGGVANGKFTSPRVLALAGKNSPEVAKYVSSTYGAVIKSASKSYEEAEIYYKQYASEIDRYNKFVAQFKQPHYQKQADAYVKEYGVKNLKVFIAEEVRKGAAILDNAEAFHKAAVAKAEEGSTTLNDYMPQVDKYISDYDSQYNVDEIAGGLVTGIKNAAELNEYGVGIRYDGKKFSPDIRSFNTMPDRDLKGLGFDGAFFIEPADTFLAKRASHGTEVAFMGWLMTNNNNNTAQQDISSNLGFGSSGELPKAEENKARGSDAPPGVNFHNYCSSLEKDGNRPACPEMFISMTQDPHLTGSPSDAISVPIGTGRNMRSNMDMGFNNPDENAPVTYLIREGAGSGTVGRSDPTDVVPYTSKPPIDKNGEEIIPGGAWSNTMAKYKQKIDGFAGKGPVLSDDDQRDFNRQVRERQGQDTSSDIPPVTRFSRTRGGNGGGGGGGEKHPAFSVSAKSDEDEADAESENFIEFMETGTCNLMTVTQEFRNEDGEGNARGTFLMRNPDYVPGYNRFNNPEHDNESETRHKMYISCEEGTEGCMYHVPQVIIDTSSPNAPLNDPDYTEKETIWVGSQGQYVCHEDPKFTAICGTRQMQEFKPNEYVWEATDDSDKWHTGFGWHDVDIVQLGGKINVLTEDKNSYDAGFILLYEVCIEVENETDQYCCEQASYELCREFINPAVEPVNFIASAYTSAHFPDNVAEGLPAISTDPGENGGKSVDGLSADWEGYEFKGLSQFAEVGRDKPAAIHWTTGVPGDTATVANFEPRQVVDSARIQVYNVNFSANESNPTQGVAFDRSPSANQWAGMIAHQGECINAGYECMCNDKIVFQGGTPTGYMANAMGANHQISNERYVDQEEVNYTGEDGLEYTKKVGVNNTPYFVQGLDLPMSAGDAEEGQFTIDSSYLYPSLGQTVDGKVWPDIETEDEDTIVRENGFDGLLAQDILFYDMTGREEKSPHMQDGEGSEKSHIMIVQEKISDECSMVTQSGVFAGTSMTITGQTAASGQKVNRVVCTEDPGTLNPIDGRDGVPFCHEGLYSPCVIHPDALENYGRIRTPGLAGGCKDPKTGGSC